MPGSAEDFVKRMLERRVERQRMIWRRGQRATRKRQAEAAMKQREEALSLSVSPPGGAHPQRTLAVLNMYDVRRELDCRHYEGCLTYAQVQRWSGFHCEACPMATGD